MADGATALDATLRGEGVRARWSTVPGQVVRAIEQVRRARVVDAADRAGGFSPGPTAVLALLAAPPDDVTAVVAGVAGYFTIRALEPPPPGLPTVRRFQEAQGRVARRWVAARLGLPPP